MALWQKGQSGNPSGRPVSSIKGLASKIRSATDDGSELLAFYLKVFRGQPLDEETGKLPTLQQRMEAAGILLDRGYGKAVTPVDLTTNEGGPPPLELDDATSEELSVLERFLTRAVPAPRPPIDIDAPTA